MPDALDLRQLLATRLTTHRLRDLLRGRVTGRLAWRGRLAAANLPLPINALIARVVRRTRLKRLEKAAVADELIAHFADGVASGATADALVRDFGDPTLAARLVRRAAIRKRPLAWHALRWTRRLFAVLLVLYAIAFARFLLGRPTVRVDYLAQVNAAALTVPEADRAWPIYREALKTLEPVDAVLWSQLNAAEQKEDPTLPDHELMNVTPTDPEWPRLAAILDANAGGIAKLREAAGKPSMGFVEGRDEWRDDVTRDLGPLWTGDDPLFAHSLATAHFPATFWLYSFDHMLRADCRLAVARRDAARAVADLDAMFGIARHLRTPLSNFQQQSDDAYQVVLELINETLVGSPDLFDDAQLVAIAHRVASIGGETASSLLDSRGDRARFYDLIQRAYTDDGHGDGRLTPLATDPRIFAVLNYRNDPPQESVADRAKRLLGTGTFATVSSRRDVLAEYDRIMDANDALLARPLRELNQAAEWPTEERLDALRRSPLWMARYAPIDRAIRLITNRDADEAERLLGHRDGIGVGVALELFRRHHAAYPKTLDELTPPLLPRVPVDRFTGGSVSYRVIDGVPVIYSVGADMKDDGGQPSVNWRDRGNRPDAHWPGHGKQTSPDAAAERRFGYPFPSSDAERMRHDVLHVSDRPLRHFPASDGDWILYDGRPTTRPVEWPHL